MSTVSVVGATGRQGLAQVKQLLKQGYDVRALSRSDAPDLGEFTHKVRTRYCVLGYLWESDKSTRM